MSAKPEIVIGSAKVRSLIGDWTEQWQRPPLPAERAQLIEEEVRSELLAREAVARGLDRNDDAIRTLLREKMELIAENAAVITEPTEVELQTFYQARKQEFGGGPIVSFAQIMLDPNRHGPNLDWDAAALLVQLRAGGDSIDPAMLGDPSDLAASYESLPQEQVDALFGPEFAQRLNSLEPGVWTGPIPSPFGLHLIRLDAMGEAPLRPLSEVHDVVREEWSMAQRQAARDRAYLALRERYRVVVEPVEPLTAATVSPAAPKQ